MPKPVSPAADKHVRLTIVGCSGSFPAPDSAASCYLVEAPHEGAVFRLVLDLGSGALGALQRFCDLESVNAVALSHLHPDHCLDLCGFWVFRKYHPRLRLPRLPIYGPVGASERMADAYGVSPSPGLSSEFEFRDWPDRPFSLGPFTVAVTLVDHPAPAYAIKVADATGSLVYSGDTGPCESLVEIARGCDLLLAEAAFVDGESNAPNLHLTGRQAATAAERAGAKRLVLTHIPPWHSREKMLAEAAPHFSGEISLASVGGTYEL